MTPQEQRRLPVIIAGAGPCGLVAALTLQNEGVPYIIVERASQEKLYSDVGSGFDIAPTALDILQNRLNLDVRDAFIKYTGMTVQTMEGKTVRDASMDSFPFDWYCAPRSEMQRILLDTLLEQNQKPESDVFHFGVTVKSYEQNLKDGTVTVTLSDGKSIIGSNLLGCDGINSAVRRHMFHGQEDPLNFCNTTVWWGKTAATEEIQKAYDKVQLCKRDGSSFMIFMGNQRQPGGFYIVPMGETFMWIYFKETDSPPARQSGDLTRRGGVTLENDDKIELEHMVADLADIIKMLVHFTPGSSITKVGLFDRLDKKTSFVDGRVALLGDAAHPQSPFLGQGVNMAITDAYVCATRLARLPGSALEDYDSKSRRKSLMKTVKRSRYYGELSMSQNPLTCWMLKTSMKWTPIAFFANDMKSADRSNRDFVRVLDQQLVQ